MLLVNLVLPCVLFIFINCVFHKDHTENSLFFYQNGLQLHAFGVAFIAVRILIEMKKLSFKLDNAQFFTVLYFAG